MLVVHKRMREGRKATDAAVGSVQSFLEHLLVDLVAGNYRHFLHEQMVRSRSVGLDQFSSQAALCSPPLVSTERELSGLVASALSAYAPVYWPEQRVVREPGAATVREDADQNKAPKADRKGATDFVAAYGARIIGVECKRAVMSLDTNSERKNVINQWVAVNNQTQTVTNHLRQKKGKHGKRSGIGGLAPAALSLLVLRVHRKYSGADGEASEHSRAKLVEHFRDWASKPASFSFLKGEGTRVTGRHQAPQFIASFTFPKEMQHLEGFKGFSGRLYPGIVFLASARVNASS